MNNNEYRSLQSLYLSDWAEDKQRLFVDMDGVLAIFQSVNCLERLYEEGYFLNLPPQLNVVEAVKLLMEQNPEKEVFILSAVLTDSKYALDEKNRWLDRYLPEIDKEHRIFPPCGENKLQYIPGELKNSDCLLDDYTANLVLWEPPARGIKLLNGINHTHGTWKGSMISKFDPPVTLKNKLLYVMEGGSLRPQIQSENIQESLRQPANKNRPEEREQKTQKQRLPKL